MKERIKPIELIHYLQDKKISSISINDDVYTEDKYSIVIKGEEYATSVEVIIRPGSWQNVMLRIALYEALNISIENDIISFYVRSSCGLGPDNKIVITLDSESI